VPGIIVLADLLDLPVHSALLSIGSGHASERDTLAEEVKPSATVRRAIDYQIRRAVSQIDEFNTRSQGIVLARFKRLRTRVMREAQVLASQHGPMDTRILRRLDALVRDELRGFVDRLDEDRARLTREASELGQDLADVPFKALGLERSLTPHETNITSGLDARGYFIDLLDRFEQETVGYLVDKLEGVRSGRTGSTQAIIDIRNKIGGPRYAAERIVRTEVGRVNKLATQRRMQTHERYTTGQRKRWNATMDGRTRPAHIGAHRQVREINEDFELIDSRGRYYCKYPMDPSLPPHQSINCRCLQVTEVSRLRIDVTKILAQV